MYSELKRMVAVALFVVCLLAGLSCLGQFADPCTLQTAMFRGQETAVAVRANRQAITIVDGISAIEVFTQKGKIMTRHYIMAPRAGGVFTTTREASADESGLFRNFF